MKIMHLIDSLDYGGSAGQVRLLGPVLARDSVTVEVCCLGPSRPWGDAMQEAGIAVHALNWTRWFDPGAQWRLRELVRQAAPDVLHVWRLPALRALALAAAEYLPRVVMSAPLPAHGALPWWDRWLLQRVRCLALAGPSEQARCMRHGIDRPFLRIVTPAVALPDDAAESAPARLAPTIVCVGKLSRERGARVAVWAFEILRHVHPGSRLLVVGAGPQLPALTALAEGLEVAPLIEFMGEQADIGPLLRDADAVWIPSTANHGRQVALEALALGRLVVASDVPCLRDVVIDGETGCLVPRGDAAELARRTHLLFQDAGTTDRLKLAARRHAQQRFSIAESVRRLREVYAA
jgi:glycosyltransferase involved in cell wall biosynthesis